MISGTSQRRGMSEDQRVLGTGLTLDRCVKQDRGLGDALIVPKHAQSLVYEKATRRGVLTLAGDLQPSKPSLAVKRICRVHPQEVGLCRIEPAL